MTRNRSRHSGRRAGSHRTCAGCTKRVGLKSSLRLVRNQFGVCQPDLFGKLPGRGMHLCPDLKCFENASRRDSASRIFKAPTSFEQPRRLAEAFLESSKNQVKSMLCVAARSAWLAMGSTSVKKDIADNRSALILMASDASSRLASETTKRASKKNIPHYRLFTANELGSLYGRHALSVVAVRHRGMAGRIEVELEKATTLERSLAKQPTQLTAAPVRGKMRAQRTGGKSAGRE